MSTAAVNPASYANRVLGVVALELALGIWLRFILGRRRTMSPSNVHVSIDYLSAVSEHGGPPTVFRKCHRHRTLSLVLGEGEHTRV